MTEVHTCIKDDGGTPNRTCYACLFEAKKNRCCCGHYRYQHKQVPPYACTDIWCKCTAFDSIGE